LGLEQGYCSEVSINSLLPLSENYPSEMTHSRK
jgi:hypothetical protein